MADPAFDLIEFQRLYDSRELAALNCVNAIQFVLSVWEAQEFEQSRGMLEKAFAQYRETDQSITEFHSLHSKKENQSDGNRTAA